MNGLEAAVAEAARTLDALHLPYMVIGGVAAGIWGEPRLTQDVDVTIHVTGSEGEAVDAIARVLRPRTTDPQQFVRETRVLPVVTASGTSVDILLSGVPFEEQAIARARTVTIGQYPVRVCTPEDLIVMKIISSRPRDREDVRGVVTRQRARLDRTYLDPIVRELAEALAQQDLLEFYESLWAE